MIELVAVPIMGALNRLRGKGTKYIRPWMFALAMGIIAGYVLKLSPEWLAVCAVAFMFGERSGWGYPLAEAMELPHDLQPAKWQKGLLLDNNWAALAFRGALWGAIPAAATLGQAWLLVPCMALSMPLSAYIAKEAVDKPERWEIREYIDGGLFTLLLVMGTYYGSN